MTRDEAIRVLARDLVKGMQEHAREMNEDPNSRAPGDPPWTADMFAGHLDETIRDGVAEEIADEVRKILEGK